MSVAALLAPAATASWTGFGTQEPDTPEDVAGGFMYLDPHIGAGEKIYFNTYETEYLTGTNPNSGDTGSRLLAAGLNHFNAMLGAWKDCNGDGYVGLGDQGLRDYRAELLFDPSVCPVGTLHNDGNWVFEYIPVGPVSDATGNTHANAMINDTAALVWGDWGLPGAGPAGTCPIAPPPHGTTSGTGFFIRYADCFTNKKIVGTVNDIDAATGLGIGFEDENHPQKSSSPLNQHFPESLFGNPETGETGTLQLDSEEDGGNEERAFTAWDCSSRSIEVKDPTGGSLGRIPIADPTGGALNAAFGDDNTLWVNLSDEEGTYFWAAQPAFKVHDPADSVADGVNQTFRGFNLALGSDDEGNHGTGGTCEEKGTDESGDNTYSDAHQLAFFYADGNHEGGTNNAGKFQTDIDFNFYDGAETNAKLREELGENTPRHLGVAGFPQWWYGPGWDAGVVYVTTPQSISRSTLQPTSAVLVTFYAFVGDTTTAAGFQVPGAGIYGAEACPGGIFEGAGIDKNSKWRCDPTQWYIDPSGTDIYEENEARVGQAYQLRDIDCFDGAVVEGVPAYTSLVLVSEGGACQDVV